MSLVGPRGFKSDIPEEILGKLGPEWRTRTMEELRRVSDLKKCEVSRRWLIEKHRWIKDKAGKIRVIGKLKAAQRKTLSVIEYCRGKKMPVRIIIAKSRKLGESTIVAVDAYERVKGLQQDALILSHDKASVAKIFKIYDRLYEHDDLAKPGLYKGKVNLREMRFQGHDGHITVATANNIYAGTGETPQYLHLSEGSKWDRGAETKTALLQAIGDNPETTLIEESTFNGEEMCFLPTWRAAYDNSKLEFIDNPAAEFGCDVKFTVTNQGEWNGYIPLFISVLNDEDAHRAFSSDEERERFMGTLDEDERNYRDNHGASPEFLNWLRFTLKLKCRNKKDVRKQEYPVTEEEAVRASGRPRFNIDALSRMPVEEGSSGRLEHSDSWDRKLVLVPDPQAFLTVFRKPLPNHDYIIGCDVRGGTSIDEDVSVEDEDERLDANAIEIFDVDGGHEEAACYHSHEAPEDLAVPLAMIGQYYNNAFIVIEANAEGYSVCVRIADLYDRNLLYHRDDWNPEQSRRERAIGHKTTTGNRNTVISFTADALNQNDIVLHNRRTIAEHKTFVLSRRGKYEAAYGKHDDHVSATWLARAGIYVARRVFEQRKKLNSVNRPVPGIAGKGLREAVGRCPITGY